MLISSSCLGSSPISVDSMNTYVHPVGEIRLAKNTYGSDFHLLSAGSNRAYHLLIQLYEERQSSQEPSLSRSRGGLYEGFFDDSFGKCFCPLLIDRIAFGTPHSGSYQFDIEQRSAKSLKSRTPFYFKKRE